MKLRYTTASGRISVEFEGNTQAELFEKIAEFQEVFENESASKDGKTSNDIRYVVREVEDNKYYELRVNSGPLKGLKKAFGVHKKGGGLFPKSKDAAGNWLPDNGWVRYNAATGKEE